MLKKLIHNLFHVFHLPQGWVEDVPDSRDYKYEDYFIKEIFGAAIPDSFIRKVEDLPDIPFQNSILSCVHCSFSFVNGYNSKHFSDNNVKLAWRYTYSQVPHYSGGTTFRDCAKVLSKQGQCINSLLPEELYYLGERAMQSASYITDEARSNAKNYRIGGYFYINPWDKTAIKTAIMTSPVIFGVYTNGNIWKSGGVIKWNGYKQYGHAIVAVGWSDTKQAWQLADWDGGGFKWLDYNYPLATVLTIRDLPDFVKEKYMKLVKTTNDPRIYALLPNGEKQHVSNPEQLDEGVRKGIYTPPVKIITKKELDQYPDTKHPITFSL